MSITTAEQRNGIITLKEITDLIEVEHNKAMKVVEKLSLEPSFGQVEKLATSYRAGNGALREIETYKLNKKQAIAVGAKLNNSLLMQLVDRLEELESVRQRPLTLNEQIALIAQGTQETNERLEVLEKTKRLEAWQEKSLHDAKNKKVYELINRLEIEREDKSRIKSIHAKVWKLFRDKYHLPRFNELPAIKFDEGVSFIQNLTIADMV